MESLPLAGLRQAGCLRQRQQKEPKGLRHLRLDRHICVMKAPEPL